MIVCNYTILFGIEFLHDAYSDKDDILRDIRIVPDKDTEQLLKGYRLHLKAVHNRLLCFVQTIATIDTSSGTTKVDVINKPLVKLNVNDTLTFRIVLNSARFFDNSNLRLYYSGVNILRFGNDSGNKRNALLSLSNKIPAYDPAEVYRPGMFVVTSGNRLFEAIRDNDPADPRNTTDTRYWKSITSFVQYVSQADLSTIEHDEKSFALISISFRKNLTGQFSLLQKSNDADLNNTILHKEYLIHFKNRSSN